jgi:Holliday junction resolvase RusA-like endonuclease
MNSLSDSDLVSGSCSPGVSDRVSGSQVVSPYGRETTTDSLPLTAPETRSLTFTIPGRPTSWKRTSGKNRHTETKMRIAQQRIRIVAREALPEGWSREGAFRILVVACYAHRWVPKRKNEGDASNLLKLVEDAIQGLVIDDDQQFVSTQCVKAYESEPSTIVHVERVG